MSEKLDKLVEELSTLSVLDAAELVKQLEQKWGVSAAATTFRWEGYGSGARCWRLEAGQKTIG